MRDPTSVIRYSPTPRGVILSHELECPGTRSVAERLLSARVLECLTFCLCLISFSSMNYSRRHSFRMETRPTSRRALFRLGRLRSWLGHPTAFVRLTSFPIRGGTTLCSGT